MLDHVDGTVWFGKHFEALIGQPADGILVTRRLYTTIQCFTDYNQAQLRYLLASYAKLMGASGGLPPQPNISTEKDGMSNSHSQMVEH